MESVAIILKSPEFNDSVGENFVIYADAGYNHAKKVGKKTVLAVVGDFDSLTKAPENENILSLEVEKNFTDGERAVRLAVEKGFSEIVIYGAYGGKIEHILGNIALLKVAKTLGANAYIKEGNKTTRLIDGKNELCVKKGSCLSLLPYGGDCSFIKSENLYYPLDGLTLTSADTRGISNVAISDKVGIEIEKGEALVVYEK